MEFSRFFRNFPDSSGFFQIFLEFFQIFLELSRFFWNCPDFSGFFQILLEFSRFFWNFSRFSGIFLDFLQIFQRYVCKSKNILKQTRPLQLLPPTLMIFKPGNTKGGSITILSTSCSTGLD